MACEGSKKATIFITHKGKTIRIESKKPGVNFTNEPSQDASGEDVTCEYKVANTSSFDNITYFEIFRIAPGKDIRIVTPAEGGVSGSTNYPSFVLYADNDVISAKYYPDQVLNMTVAFNGNCTGNGYLVEVTDQGGRIFKKFFPGEQPKVEVACDDKCPPRQMKCKCEKYPGYCCIPCSSVVPKINNMAAKLRKL